MKLKITILLALTVLLNCSCSDFLDLEPKNKVTADRLFSDPKGVQAYMANLYYQLPIEDFTFDQDKGFNYNYNGAQNFGINTSNNKFVTAAMFLIILVLSGRSFRKKVD